MRILTVDIGTGTQDILLFDSHRGIENNFKLVLPSPTMIVHNKLRQATLKKQAVVLTGSLMGGGPSAWAAEAHIRAGLPVFATPASARSFNDDLDAVQEMGIRLISDDEALHLPDEILRIRMQDFDFTGISGAFAGFGVSLNRLDAVAVAVFDHGYAPKGISDRQFRFDYLDNRIRSHISGLNRSIPNLAGSQNWNQALASFAFQADQIPPSMTRLQAVSQSGHKIDAPLLVMDTAPAAVLGATYDPHLRAKSQLLIANIGNFHTLAFHLGPAGIEGLFEHHTGFLNQPKLEDYLDSLAAASLTHSVIFGDMGHGALVYNQIPFPLDDPDFGIAVTGPRRNLLNGSRLRPYFAVPFGDMMISGCIGLLSACAVLFPDLSQPIQDSLDNLGDSRMAPWDSVEPL
jgi:uncharacterized protein (DUF1786 family)